MLCNAPQTLASVKDFGLSPNATISQLFEYLEKVLAVFQYVGILGDADDWEDDISQELVRILNTHNPRVSFYFDKQHKNKKKNSSYPDIGVCVNNGNYFFHLEAKLFVKEYVYGRTGGIERFKREDHGVEYIKSVPHQLPYSGIIGYMLDKDFQYWHSKVNLWIDSQINSKTKIKWTNADKLQLMYKKTKIARFHSVNKTLSGEINLVHLWVNLIK